MANPVHFPTQEDLDGFIERVGALRSQIRYLWVLAKQSGDENQQKLEEQLKYIKCVMEGLCVSDIGATDNLLTNAELDSIYENIIALGYNLCDDNFLLNDTIQ